MKRTLLIIVATMLFTTITVLIIFEIIAQNNQLAADVQENIHSNILAEDRTILVHLPVEYDSTKKYPVMYVLDGSSQDFRMAGIAELLSRAEVVQDMIIVGIPNTNRNRDVTPHYILQDSEGDEWGQGDNFLNFIIDELIPFIESNYPVNGTKTLAGHSRSGLFAFYAYLERPEIFDGIYCFSPAFWRDDAIILDKARSFYNSNQPEQPFIFLSLGTEENEKMKKAYSAMTGLLDRKRVSNVFHTYTFGANHSNNLYYSTPIALKKWEEHKKPM